MTPRQRAVFPADPGKPRAAADVPVANSPFIRPPVAILAPGKVLTRLAKQVATGVCHPKRDGGQKDRQEIYPVFGREGRPA